MSASAIMDVQSSSVAELGPVSFVLSISLLFARALRSRILNLQVLRR
jgi:hypothetical protein